MMCSAQILSALSPTSVPASHLKIPCEHVPFSLELTSLAPQLVRPRYPALRRLFMRLTKSVRGNADWVIRYRLIHPASEITDGDVKVLRDWARGEVVSSLGVSEKSSATEAPGNATHGKLVFASRCGGCHTLRQNREGPKLAGVLGRISGTVPGFHYSVSLKKAALRWDAQSLDKWLTDPNDLVPMNNMYFHVAKVDQRSDLIAYLKAYGN